MAEDDSKGKSSILPSLFLEHNRPEITHAKLYGHPVVNSEEWREYIDGMSPDVKFRMGFLKLEFRLIFTGELNSATKDLPHDPKKLYLLNDDPIERYRLHFWRFEIFLRQSREYAGEGCYTIGLQTPGQLNNKIIATGEQVIEHLETEHIGNATCPLQMACPRCDRTLRVLILVDDRLRCRVTIQNIIKQACHVWTLKGTEFVAQYHWASKDTRPFSRVNKTRSLTPSKEEKSSKRRRKECDSESASVSWNNDYDENVEDTMDKRQWRMEILYTTRDKFRMQFTALAFKLKKLHKLHMELESRLLFCKDVNSENMLRRKRHIDDFFQDIPCYMENLFFYSLIRRLNILTRRYCPFRFQKFPTKTELAKCVWDLFLRYAKQFRQEILLFILDNTGPEPWNHNQKLKHLYEFFCSAKKRIEKFSEGNRRHLAEIILERYPIC